MDIARYIGLFLLKNKYCCLQGLGNLEIKKISSRQQNAALSAPYYEVVLNPTGSIDDTLANFIATAEGVSIAKASNEIREFISFAKNELAAGNDVDIPSVGKYMSDGLRTRFELDPAYSHAAQPVMVVPQTRPVAPVEEPEINTGRPSSVNWGLIALWTVILLVAGTIIFFGVRYLSNQSASTETVAVVDSPMVEVTPAQDTALNVTPAADSSTAMNAATSDTPQYNFVISSYKKLEAAKRREKQLNGYGHQVSLITNDSLTFYVVKSIRVLPADTLHMKDSLSKILNPAGVTILQ